MQIKPKIPDDKGITTEEIVQNIKDNIPLSNSILELRRKTGYSYTTLRKYAEDLGLELPKSTRGRKRGNFGEYVSKGIEENFGRALSKLHLSELVGCSPIVVDKYLEKLGLELENKAYRRGKVFLLKGNRKPNNLFNRMILRGATLEEMAEASGKTRELARHYINNRGLYDLWRSRRAKRVRAKAYESNAAKNIHSEIAGLVKAHLLQKIEEEHLHVRKAFEYYLSRRKCSHQVPVEDIIKLFEKYYKAKEAGEVLSLKELTEDTGIKSATEAKRLLNAIGEKSLYWTIEHRQQFTEEEEENIKRAHEMGVGAENIGYFIGRSPAVIAQKKIKLELKKRNRSLKQFGSGETLEHLTYRKASEICLAKDLGYSKAETMELLDISERVYDYAMENKEEVAGKIERVLNVLRPKNKHPRPYITSTDGEYLVRIDDESLIGFGSEEEASGYIGRVVLFGISPERVEIYRKIDVDISN